MRSPGESYPAEHNTREIERFFLTADIQRAFNGHEYETELLLVDDSLGLRIESVLGGAVAYESDDEIEYSDITLMRSGIIGHQLTSLVVKGEQYDIPDDSPDRVLMTSIPQHYLDAKALSEVRDLVNDATWSKEASIRAAEQRRESLQKPKETA